MSTINIFCPQCGACMVTRMSGPDKKTYSKDCASSNCRFYNIFLKEEYIHDMYFAYINDNYQNAYSIYIDLEVLKIEKKNYISYPQDIFKECYSEDFNKIHYSKLNEFYSYIKNIIVKLEENSVLE